MEVETFILFSLRFPQLRDGYESVFENHLKSFGRSH